MKLYILRDDIKLPVIVKLGALVSDLQKAVKTVTLKYLRSVQYEGLEFVNWKYFWRNYCLCFKGQKLEDKDKSLHHHYGLRNKNELIYVKKCKNNIF